MKAPIRAIYAGIGAYIGLNAAAAVVAVLLGIQPALFHEPNGHALYFPFGLHITLPAMLGTHLLIAGPAEAVVTVLVVRYLQASGMPLYGDVPRPAFPALSYTPASGHKPRWAWIGLLALIALSPLGLLAKGDAWGEWNKEGLAKQIEQVEGKGKAYVPKGVAAQEEHGYSGVKGLQDYASEQGAKGFLFAGVIGVSIIVLLLFVGGRLLVHHSESMEGLTEEEAMKRGVVRPALFLAISLPG